MFIHQVSCSIRTVVLNLNRTAYVYMVQCMDYPDMSFGYTFPLPTVIQPLLYGRRQITKKLP